MYIPINKIQGKHDIYILINKIQWNYEIHIPINKIQWNYEIYIIGNIPSLWMHNLSFTLNKGASYTYRLHLVPQQTITKHFSLEGTI